MRIVDALLAEDYSLWHLPSLAGMNVLHEMSPKLCNEIMRQNRFYAKYSLLLLAFFRHSTPILYTGDINNEEEVFEFLFQNKYTADEDIDLEEVDEEKLEILINHIDFVVVLFYKEQDPASKQAQLDVDSIDDNLKVRIFLEYDSVVAFDLCQNCPYVY